MASAALVRTAGKIRSVWQPVAALKKASLLAFGTNGTKKDVILKNEPGKSFKFSKRLHG
jgi:hypothetical protein